MLIGSMEHGETSISTADATHILVRGNDLANAIIPSLTFTEMFCLLLTGTRPSPTLCRMVDASLCAIAEHGLVPSVQAMRMTLAADPSALQGAVAAGLLGCGHVVLGAAESAGLLLAECADRVEDEQYDVVAQDVVLRAISGRRHLPGFGHPLHKPVDPRAKALVKLAHDLGSAGRHVAMLEALEIAMVSLHPRSPPVNVSLAIPAVLLDAGFPIAAMKGIPLLARTASLIAHAAEEKVKPIGFVLAHHAETGIQYVPPDSEVMNLSN